MAAHHSHHHTSTPPLFLHRNGERPSNHPLELNLLGLFNRSNMLINNGAAAAAKNSRKRKINEVGGETSQRTPGAANLFNLQGGGGQGPPTTSPNPANHSYVQHILNAASPRRPFSFMSLLTAPDPEDELRDDLASQIKFQKEHIDKTIQFHNESLKQRLFGMMDKQNREIEEMAAKKLREKEVEMYKLEKTAEHYKGEATRLKTRVRYLERLTAQMKDSLDEARSARRYAEQEEEDAESSFVDPDRVGPVMLDCKGCEREVATIMLWPCRHVCLCKGCQGRAKKCPVCGVITTTSVEIILPPN